MADASKRPSSCCPWCGTVVASSDDACPDCGRRPDWRAWVDTWHAQAEELAPPGWEGLATNEPLDSVANVTGYLRRELAALRILGENGRGEFWLERANELYANIFRALSARRIWDRPEQLPKATDCDEAERRLDELWRWFAAKEGNAALSGENAGDSGFIGRLLAGPEHAELTPTELALLDAHLQQPISMAAIQQEKKATGESETNAKRNKLKLIRDFNRNLQSTNNSPTPAKAKRPGRTKADYETQQREAQLAADWKRAYEAGTYKADFAKDNNLTVRKLDALLDRVAKRIARSDN